MTFAASLVSHRRARASSPPGPGSFDLPPVFSVGGVGVTKPMLLLVLAAIVVFALLLRRRPQARRSCRASCSSPARRRLRLRAQRRRPRHHRHRGLHALRAVPGHAVLLHPGQQHLRDRSRSSSSRRFAGRLGLRAGRPVAGSSTTASASASTGSSATSSSSACRPGVTGPILLLLVPLEFLSNIIVRPVTLAAASVREHVRRPHPAAAVRDRRRVPPPAPAALISRRRRRWPACWRSRSPSWSCWSQFLQAYVFTLLNAMYISGALADEH